MRSLRLTLPALLLATAAVDLENYELLRITARAALRP